MTRASTSAANAVAMPAAAATQPGRLRRLYARIARAIEVHHRRRLLQALPNYVLKDIGLSRADIDSIVEAAVDGRQDPTRRHPPRLAE